MLRPYLTVYSPPPTSHSLAECAFLSPPDNPNPRSTTPQSSPTYLQNTFVPSTSLPPCYLWPWEPPQSASGGRGTGRTCSRPTFLHLGESYNAALCAITVHCYLLIDHDVFTFHRFTLILALPSAYIDYYQEYGRERVSNVGILYIRCMRRVTWLPVSVTSLEFAHWSIQAWVM